MSVFFSLLIAFYIIYLAFSNKKVNVNSAEDFIESASELFFSIVGFFVFLIICLVIYSYL